MITRAVSKLMLLSLLTVAGTAGAFDPNDIGGLWNFRGGDLHATIGQDMTYGAVWTEQNTVFGSTDGGVTVPDINGVTAKVMHVPQRQGEGSVYLVPHGAPVPNGGAVVYATEYTLVMDVLFVPATWTGGVFGSGVHNSFIDINLDDTQAIEYQVFRGSLGWDNMTLEQGADPNIPVNTWHRLAIAVDAGNVMKLYKNGVHVATYLDTDVPDSSWWSTGSTLRFAREMSEAYVNSIATFSKTLDDAEIAGLGGPDAEGIIVPSQCGDPGTEYLALDVTGPQGIPDCVVDMHDLALFSGVWLACSDPADPRCDPYWKTAN